MIERSYKQALMQLLLKHGLAVALKIRRITVEAQESLESLRLQLQTSPISSRKRQLQRVQLHKSIKNSCRKIKCNEQCGLRIWNTRTSSRSRLRAIFNAQRLTLRATKKNLTRSTCTSRS